MIRLNDVEIAKEHTDLSLETIQQLVETYNISKHEAPVVIGHPENDAPAYGWVKGIKYNNKILYADIEVQPEFKELLDKELYKKRSIAIYRDFENTGKKGLRHLGFLGATPPRIKGMQDIVFADNNGKYDILDIDEKTTI